MEQQDSSYTSVIFDLDGTLLYTIPDIADAINNVLLRYGYPEHEREFYRTAVGWGLYKATRIALPDEDISDEKVQRMGDEVVSRYRENPVASTVPYSGVVDLLDTLVDRGIRLSVLSNKEDGLTKDVVSRTLGTKYFEVIRGRSTDFPAKPDPAGALFIMEQMGVRPEEVIYVGDSDVDMETAVRGGMYPVGVLWGYRSREEILDGGAKMLVSEPKEILSLFSERVVSPKS
ncbi:MAG: HAD family hydrolase [Spirochaetaceae bacterium]